MKNVINQDQDVNQLENFLPDNKVENIDYNPFEDNKTVEEIIEILSFVYGAYIKDELDFVTVSTKKTEVINTVKKAYLSDQSSKITTILNQNKINNTEIYTRMGITKSGIISAIPGFFVDISYADTEGLNGYHNKQNTLNLASALQYFPPNICIDNGKSLTCGWVAQTLWEIENSEEKKQILEVYLKLQNAINSIMKDILPPEQCEYQGIEVRKDFNNFVPIPNFIYENNYQTEFSYPKQDRKYNWTEILHGIYGLEELAKTVRLSSGIEEKKEFNYPSAISIIDRCNFVKYCIDNIDTIVDTDKQMVKALVSIFRNTEEGKYLNLPNSIYNQIASNPHTKSLLSIIFHQQNNIDKNYKPTGCRKIKEQNFRICQGCENKVANPIQLGSKDYIEVQEEIIESEKNPITEPIEFPLEAMPIECQQFCIETAKAQKTVPEVIAAPMLAVLGVAAGNTAMTSADTHRAKGNLWVTVLGDSGIGKSSILELLCEPLVEDNRNSEKLHEELLVQYDKDVAMHKLKCKEDKNYMESEPKPPRLQQVKIDNATVEAVIKALNEIAQRGLILTFDEVLVFLRSFGLYKGGKGGSSPDRYVYMALAGSNIYSEQNIARSGIVNHKTGYMNTMRVYNPFLSLTGFSTVENFIEEIEQYLKAGATDGFPERFLYVLGKKVKHPRFRGYSENSIENYQQLYWKLKNELMYNGKLKEFPLSEEAADYHMEQSAKLEEEQEDPYFPSHLQAYWNKMPNYALRITLVLHLCDYVMKREDETIPLETSKRAWAIAKYFMSTAAIVLNQATSDGGSKHLKYWKWIKQHNFEEITSRILISKFREIKNSKQADDLMRDLAKEGFGRYISSGEINEKRTKGKIATAGKLIINP